MNSEVENTQDFDYYIFKIIVDKFFEELNTNASFSFKKDYSLYIYQLQSQFFTRDFKTVEEIIKNIINAFLEYTRHPTCERYSVIPNAFKTIIGIQLKNITNNNIDIIIDVMIELNSLLTADKNVVFNNILKIINVSRSDSIAK